jgi:hypothetical protein
VTLEEVRFRAFRGGELAASGTAAKASYRRDTGAVEALDATVQVPRPGTPRLDVAARTLRGELGADAWDAEGGVVLTRGDATVRTESARWTGADGLVRGDRPVEVTGPGYRLTGSRFTADPRTGDVDVRGDVRLVAGGGAR